MNPQIGKLSPFIVMEVLERANELQRQGVDVIHLEVGEPDFDMPECVSQATVEALRKSKTHYTHSLGDFALRQAIADFHKREYGISVNPDCIVVTSGSSPAILLALMVLCEAGGEVIVSNPGYACYSNFILVVAVFQSKFRSRPKTVFSLMLRQLNAPLRPKHAPSSSIRQ